VREGDRDRWLVTLWAPAAARAGLFALWALDLALVRVVETTTEPRLGEIRLAWWREALQRLDRAPPPPEPVLTALGAAVLPRVVGAVLAGLEDGALAWLGGDMAGAARLRGEALFAAAALLLGGDDPGDAGIAWASGDLARRGVGVALAEPPRRLARALRPLLALARLGARPATELPGALPRQLLIARTMLLG